jgi:hypothetical protein
MKKHPAEHTPEPTFAEAMAAVPLMPAAEGKFIVSLFSQGFHLGYLGQNEGRWAVLSQRGSAQVLEQYPYNGVTYYRLSSDTSSYLSLNDQAYVGFYGWIGARGWKLEGRSLISLYNNEKLSLFSKDNGYLFCWNAYTVLDVTFEKV